MKVPSSLEFKERRSGRVRVQEIVQEEGVRCKPTDQPMSGSIVLLVPTPFKNNWCPRGTKRTSVKKEVNGVY